jgi:thiamine-monophosphate kinase
MNYSLEKLGEFGLINKIRKVIPKSSLVIKGIGDDTAVLPLNQKKYLLFTTDMLVEGVHFTKKMLLSGIGHKAIACSVSDIAAMGGVPKYAVVSLGVAAKEPCFVIEKIYSGMIKTARDFKLEIVGGDTVKTDKIILNVAMIGEVERKRLITRDGARAGDKIFVTGVLGNSFQSQWHLRFSPRVKESAYLGARYHPSAMIDISDGLSADLGHIMEGSSLGAVIDQEKIPLRQGAVLNNALVDGEDFELLFTVSPKDAGRLARDKKYRFFCIGEMTHKKGKLELIKQGGKRQMLAPGGFTHF